MNEYDLLGLMDTHRAMKKQGLDVPASFLEFMTGIQPVEDVEPVSHQLHQGNTTYDSAINEVEQRNQTAQTVSNDLGLGESTIGSDKLSNWIPGTRRPYAQHQQAIDEGKRLQDRRELGYDL
jgi:hypothetical protein